MSTELTYIRYSTVVMWDHQSDHPGAMPHGWATHGATPGSTGAPGRPLVLDDPQALLPPRTPLVPTGVPTGVEAVVRSIRSRRHTDPGPQRSGHDDQTPGVPTGGFPPAVLVAPTAPLLPPSGQDPAPRLGQGAGVEDPHPPRHCAPDGLFDAGNGPGPGGPTRLMPGPTLGVLEPDRLDVLMPALACLGGGRPL